MTMSLFKAHVRVMTLLLILMEMVVTNMMIIPVGVVLMTQTHLFQVKLVASVEEELMSQPILTRAVYKNLSFLIKLRSMVVTLKAQRMISINTDLCAGQQILAPVMTMFLIRMEMVAPGMLFLLVGVATMTQTHLYQVKLVAHVEEGRLAMRK